MDILLIESLPTRDAQFKDVKVTIGTQANSDMIRRMLELQKQIAYLLFLNKGLQRPSSKTFHSNKILIYYSTNLHLLR